MDYSEHEGNVATETIMNAQHPRTETAAKFAGSSRTRPKRASANSLKQPPSNQNSKKTRCVWTPQEDRRLIELHSQFGNKWHAIARIIGNRDNVQCRTRYVTIITH